jgi:hypothetical protein
MDGANWISLGSAGITHAASFTRVGLTTYAGVASGDTGAAFDYFDYTLPVPVEFGTGGVVTDTTGYNNQTVIKDSNYLYLAGSNFTGSTWRLEKRDITNGSLCSGGGTCGGDTFGTAGIVTGPSGLAYDLVSDGTYMYAVGNDNNNDWRIEKRLLTTGAVDSGFGTSGVVTDAAGYRAHSIAIDSTYMYVVGTTTGGDWLMQKRQLSNGAICDGAGGVCGGTVFGTAGSITIAAGNGAWDVVIDGTHMYIAGDTDGLDWRIEKRLLTTGELDSGFGVSGVVSSTTGQIPYALTKDSSYMYVVGYGSDSNWRVEKRQLSNGNICDGGSNCGGTVFGTAGAVTGAALSNIAYGVAVDSTYVYVAGEDSTPDWRIEKRLITTGAVDSNFGTSGVVTSDSASRALNDVIADTTYMYVVGYNTSNQWRIERRLITNGNLAQ